MRGRMKTVRPKVKMRALASEDLRRGAHYGADRAITGAKVRTRNTIKAAGLGRLSGAVASTSSLSNPRWRGRGPNGWGALYARGGQDSRANQALSIYSEGGTIFPIGNRQWLWFATKAVPTRAADRKKMTPAGYKRSGLEASLGKLVFVPVNARLAKLVIRKVNVSKRTGRARQFGGRTPRGSAYQKEVVAFWGIRYTRRAQRFNQQAIMIEATQSIPRFVREYQGKSAGSGGVNGIR